MCWGLPILFPLMPVLSLRFFFYLYFPYLLINCTLLINRLCAM